MASLTFIRREMSELESIGHTISRFAIQPWSEALVDVEDQHEANKTRYLKSGGPLALALSLLTTACCRPKAFWKAWSLSRLLSRSSDRSWVYHLAYFAEACRLRKWLYTEQVEHLHIHFATNSTEVGMLCRVLGGPTYSFTVHGPEEFDRASCQSLDQKTGHAKFVAPISSFGRSQMMRWCPSSEWHKLHVVRCGVDAFYLDTPPSKVPDNPTLVCVGRLCEQKGQLLLIEAVGKLVKQGVNVQLRLVGDGPMRSECEAATGERKLQKQVVITGWASGEQVRDEIANARIFVLPSFAEGLPVVIMEALALERPVISTYVAGIPELVKPGVNGWLVPAGDVDSLVEAIREALETPIQRLREMGTCGSQAVLERHDIRKEAAKLAKLFHGL